MSLPKKILLVIRSRKTKKYTKRISEVIIALILFLVIIYFYPAASQSIRPELVSQKVYESLSYIPLENKYISSETGQIAVENTLITRFVRYHQDVKKRPTIFRLDWKLTIADYLGANEPIKEERYPGRTTLTVNPMEKDIAAIGALNLRQRNELIDLIVSVYNPQSPKKTPDNNSSPPPSPEPTTTPTPSPRKPPLSQPGDADLLAP